MTFEPGMFGRIRRPSGDYVKVQIRQIICAGQANETVLVELPNGEVYTVHRTAIDPLPSVIRYCTYRECNREVTFGDDDRWHHVSVWPFDHEARVHDGG